MTEMSPAEEVFFAALEKVPSERSAYLDQACAGQPELRARVDKLLAAHPRIGEFLEQGQAAAAATATFAADKSNPTAAFRDESESEGSVVAGKYKLLQQIGEGGMGTVWMADQTEPVKRRVAVKLIRVERGASATILARFEAERQAIALMDHPHIAKLLDAGTTASGSPYFVMELVKGVPLNEFCDAHKLSIPERLNLFLQICSAVQHAHQKGIIHRDLKPTNILVESHDDKPVPKVIDFGLAKATTGLQLTEHTLFTAFGSVMGTPLYMAPEQAKFNAVDIDTRADVYALGVILYELLTGTTPLTRDTVKKAALDEMLKLIREQEAPTPSSRLSSAGSSPSVAANRQMEPAKLSRLLRGELDWIVLKALEKDRTRRYETANGFAADVRRYQAGEAVLAVPPSVGYRLRKVVRRNRGPVAAAAVVLAVLLGGIMGTTWQAIRAQRHLEHTQATQRDLRDALRSMIDTTMTDLVSRKENLTDEDKQFIQKVRGHYEKLASTTGNETESLEIRLEAINGVLRLMSEFEPRQDRLPLSQEAAALAKQLLDREPNAPERQKALAVQLDVVAGLLGRRQHPNSSPEAESLWKEGFERLDSVAREYPADMQVVKSRAGTRNNYSIYLGNLKRYAEQEAVLREEIATLERMRGQFPDDVNIMHLLSFTQSQLAKVLRREGTRRTEVDELNERSLTLDRECVRRGGSLVFRNNLANGLLRRGLDLLAEKRLTEAKPFLAEGAEVFERLVAEFPSRVSYGVNLCSFAHLIARAIEPMGDKALALAWHRRAYTMAEALPAWAFRVNTRDFYLKEHLQGQARVLAKLNRQSEADELLRKATQVIERGNDPSDSLRLACDLIATGNLKDGIERVDRFLGATANPMPEQWLIAAMAFRAASDRTQEFDARKNFARRASDCVEKIQLDEIKRPGEFVAGLVGEYLSVCRMLILTQQDEPFDRLAARLRAAFRYVLENPSQLPWTVEEVSAHTRVLVINRLIARDRKEEALALSDLSLKIMKREYSARRTNIAYSSGLDACLYQQITLLADMHRPGEAVAVGRELLARSSPEKKSDRAALLAALLAKDGQSAEAERLAADAVSGVNHGAETNYNLCCTYALLGDQSSDLAARERYHSQAVAALNKAIAKGFRLHQQLDTDSDLNGIRHRPEFRKLLADLAAKYPIQAKPKPLELAPPPRAR